MNLGFNSNVRVGEAVYHVQTEDRGPAHPFIDTVVYLSGRVVHKRSTNYEKYVRAMSSEKKLAEWLRDRVSQQHREIIADLETGKLPASDKEKSGSASGKGDAAAGLELKLQNPHGWFAAGNIVLEIALSEAASRKTVGDADVEACIENEAHRTPCAKARTDASGNATLRFPVPASVPEGAFLVVRAVSGTRGGELRFRLKSKSNENAPAPVGR
jgi:hypothetical protein